MYKLCLLVIVLCMCSCKATTYYVIRHAERAGSPNSATTMMSPTTMSSDVPLSDAGKQRAEALKEQLKNKQIRHIFSTNYNRTRSTVLPLANATNVQVQSYNSIDSPFIYRIKQLTGNVLVVGHSNTVDDLVNALSGRKEINGDLPDSAYGDLFIIKRRGRHYVFEKKHFGVQ